MPNDNSGRNPSPPSASRQVAFHQLLVSARKTWLHEALSEALSSVSQVTVKAQLTQFVPADVQQLLASAGIRDEHVFPTPVVLIARPTLIGYYRLLLGIPQKTFYGNQYGMGVFKSMENRGATPNPRQLAALPGFCSAMGTALADLIRQLSPTVTTRDVHELPLLTLGSYFQGANNNLIGQKAIADVFLVVSELVQTHITHRSDQVLTLHNASNRKVLLSLSADPDIRIEEEFSGELRRKVAIEIKGGTDRSNAHNRAGEAEKSHQKAKNQGFRDYWTLIAKKGLDIDALRSESPTTNSWFDVSQVLAREGPDWAEFRSRLADSVGIPISDLPTPLIQSSS